MTKCMNINEATEYVRIVAGPVVSAYPLGKVLILVFTTDNPSMDAYNKIKQISIFPEFWTYSIYFTLSLKGWLVDNASWHLVPVICLKHF